MYTKGMSDISTIQLPDGTIRVEKIIYKSDFEKIKKALQSISSVKKKSKKDDEDKPKTPAHS